MQPPEFPFVDFSEIPTPCFVIDENRIKDNLRVLRRVKSSTNCKILLALKAYALYPTFSLMKNTIDGVCAGSWNETRLGREEFNEEVHSYFPAFKEEDFKNVLGYSDYIIFNSLSQLDKFMPLINEGKIFGEVKVGLRVNPEIPIAGKIYSSYNPCSENSRLGINAETLKGRNLEEITGLHFHALCEQGADELEVVLIGLENKFSDVLRKMDWVNFGGGHSITQEGYNLQKLIRIIRNFKERYPNIRDVYLEPGEAVVKNAGVLVSSVLDIIKQEKKIAILDTSVECHFPDILITKNDPRPYVQNVLGAEFSRGDVKRTHRYILAGVSCAAGDVFGEYYFKNPLEIGDKIVFTDCAHYTMVKTSNFCGINPPSIAIRKTDGKINVITKFKYQDYKERLG